METDLVRDLSCKASQVPGMFLYILGSFYYYTNQHLEVIEEYGSAAGKVDGDKKCSRHMVMRLKLL